jgi:nucleoside-triphosphatase
VEHERSTADEAPGAAWRERVFADRRKKPGWRGARAQSDAQLEALGGHADKRTAQPLKLLLEGRPGAGKTTVAQHVASMLAASGVPVRGFVTQEIREKGARIGFSIETLAGARAVLAHVDFAGPPRVSRYGVDLNALERIALPVLRDAGPHDVLVVDELGKMELASKAFREAVSAIFDEPRIIVATVQSTSDPLTDALKRRPDVETLRVSPSSRHSLPGQIAERVTRVRRGYC